MKDWHGLGLCCSVEAVLDDRLVLYASADCHGTRYFLTSPDEQRSVQRCCYPLYWLEFEAPLAWIRTVEPSGGSILTARCLVALNEFVFVAVDEHLMGYGEVVAECASRWW